MAHDFQDGILSALETVLEPIARAATEDTFRRELFGRIGWEIGGETGFPEQNLIAALADFSTSFQTLRTALASKPQTLGEVVAALKAAATTVSELKKVAALVSNGAPAQFTDAATQLLNVLVADGLQLSQPVLHAVLRLLTVIRDQTTELIVANNTGVPLRRQVTYPKIDFNRLLVLFNDPVTTLKSEYGLSNGLTNANATADLLFPRIVDVLTAMHVEVTYGHNSVVTPVDLGPVGNDIAAHTLTLFRPLPSGDVALGGGFGLSALLEEALGLVLNPFGVLTFNDVIGNWLLTGTLTVSPGGIAIKGATITFPTGVSNGSAQFDLVLNRLPDLTEVDAANPTTAMIGSAGGTRVELGDFAVALNASFSAKANDFGFVVQTGKSAIVIAASDGDGFIGSVLSSETQIAFDLELGWSRIRGLHFKGGASLDVVLPVNVSVGPVTVPNVRLGIAAGPSVGTVTAAADVVVALGPVVATVEGLGARLDLSFPDAGGNLGPANGDLGFKLPTGIGIAIDAGSVSGGGFIKFDEPNGRYFGALELNVYEISVKAFGLIETKFPDGHKGFSFIVVISAEFTPIQLGFGFTLNGVGGLLGINRTLDEAGLLAAVKKGELENVLFPHDVVANAPHIMQDLQTIFPAAPSHYVFGPMAKLAWIGLVEGELGLILELPGPRLAILGTVRIALPTKEDALVDLQFDVSGVLDFPKKRFSLDASLAKESRVGDFPISGDMAMRLSWGDKPNFALAIGGFNKHYAPPAGFPALKRMTIDLGVHGNPSINLSGYTALTSNTAQVGARLEARISQSGAELYGFVAFDALFVFSPFSFVGTLDGAVGVNFHGAGFSLQFHGQISGPSPWMISGQVCVSILFWDACVGFTLPPLGNDKKVSLPGIDPWVGSLPARPDGTQDVPGLKPALEDPRNWGGGKPAGSFAVVTLTDSATDKPPVDPLGSAIVRQKVCPLDIPITRFAGAKPPQVRNFVIESVKIGEEGQMSAAITNVPRVDDLFAPAQYTEMKDADKLSSASFVQMHAGIAVSSDALEFGPQVPKGLLYDTIVFDPVQPEQEHDKQYNPQQVNVTVASGMSGAARGGIRQQGSFKFVDTTAPFKVRFLNEAYVLSSVGSLKVTGNIPLTNPVSRPMAVAALLAAGTTDPAVLRNAQVTPFYNARP